MPIAATNSIVVACELIIAAVTATASFTVAHFAFVNAIPAFTADIFVIVEIGCHSAPRNSTEVFALVAFVDGPCAIFLSFL